jgi:hypothetical protein
MLWFRWPIERTNIPTGFRALLLVAHFPDDITRNPIMTHDRLLTPILETTLALCGERVALHDDRMAKHASATTRD